MTKKLDKIKDIIIRFKDLTTIGIANAIASTIAGIFWLYMAALLGTEHYGEISYFIAIAGVASSVCFLGAGNTITVYTSKGEKIHSTLFFICGISSSITAIILFSIFLNSGVSVYVISYTIFGLVTAEILGQKLYRMYSKYLIMQKILMVTLSITLYYLIGPQGVILGYALSYLLYSIRLYKVFKDTKINFSLIKPRLGFMTNSYMLDLSKTFSAYVDKLIIGPIFGFALLGNYQLGIQFLSLLSILPGIVYQYILPHDASGNANRKLKKLTIFVSVILAVLGILLAPVILPVLFPKFTKAIEVIQIVSLAIIPYTINLTYISKFLGNENSKIVMRGSGIYLLIQITSIFVLGQYFGVYGISAAIVLATSSESMFLIIINKITDKKLDKNFNL